MEKRREERDMHEDIELKAAACLFIVVRKASSERNTLQGLLFRTCGGYLLR